MQDTGKFLNNLQVTGKGDKQRLTPVGREAAGAVQTTVVAPPEPAADRAVDQEQRRSRDGVR